MKKFVIVFISFLCVSTASIAIDGKPVKNKAKEIIPVIDVSSKIIGNTRVDQKTEMPLAIYNPNYLVNGADPETMARQYLEENANYLQHKNGLNDIAFIHATETPGGFRVQFIQHVNGLPVYGSGIKISINRNNQVVFVMNGYKELGQVETDIQIGANEAVVISKNHLEYNGPTIHESVETIIYNTAHQRSVIAHLVKIVPSEDIFGDWEIIVDATNEEILRVEDKACYNHPDGVDGIGNVFDPDPVTNATTIYGADGFEDFQDGISDSLTAQLKEVTLKDITQIDDTSYKLEGPYAQIVDLEQPYTGLYIQSTSDFIFNRDNLAFEAVNIYYHVDHSMRYINEELGFDVSPFQYEGGVKFDPHGFDNAINAHYVGSTGHIAFGSPANYVDLGEDNAVIIHELGHGLHHWITNGGLSQVDGLSEGQSDYWAQSYTRSLGKYQPEDEAYDWFGVWGGQPAWGGPSLRVTNFDGHYPEALNGSVHHDGQMWSSSLMLIYDLIGREYCDIDCWEAISMTNGNSNQIDAANAFIQADNDLYDGANLVHIIPVFVARGYIEDLVTVLFQADNRSGTGPLSVNFTDQSITYLNPIESWEWDFDDDGVVDSYEQNPSHTYEESGFYTVRLTIFDGNDYYNLAKTDFISVNEGFYVYESDMNERDYSGTFIKEFLEAQGYEVMYSPFVPSSFDGFEAVFLTLGNGSANRTVFNNSLAQTVREYLEEGGNVYLEGGDAFGIDQSGNAPLRELFGLQNTSSGTSNPVVNLSGYNDAITNSMIFNGSKQSNINSIDIYTPNQTEGSKAALTEDEYGIVAVQNAGADYNNHTFCFSYALAELEDTDPESSRYNLMVRLMEFFGYPLEDGYVVSNFTADVMDGLPSLEVMFSDWSFSDEGFIVNSWAWDFDGDGLIDSHDQNPVWTYDFGGIYDVMLVVSNGNDTDTLVKKDFITVRSGIFVYEQKPDEPGYSGGFIRDYLEDHYYDEVSYSNNLPSELTGYDAVFLSFGNSEDKRTPITDEIRGLINNYGQTGGRIYLEGGDALGFDLSSDYNFWLLFGLSYVDDGENNPIEDLQGHEGAITNGMEFSGTNQPYVRSIDTYQTLDGLDDAIVAFTESDYGPVAVQLSGEQMFGQHTFCFSYAIAELEDGEGMNTRDVLLSRILDFFGIVTNVEETEINNSNNLKVFPNPTNSGISLELYLEKSGDCIIEMYDLSGMQVLSTSKSLLRGSNKLDFNISHMDSGVYYFRIKSGDHSESVKWIKIDY